MRKVNTIIGAFSSRHRAPLNDLGKDNRVWFIVIGKMLPDVRNNSELFLHV